MYLLVLISLVLAYWALKWLHFRFKYDVHKLPSPPQLPFIGHMYHFLQMGDRINQNKFIREWYEKLGRPKIILKTIPGDTAVVIFDCEFLKNTVLGRDGFPRDKIYKKMTKIFVGHRGPPISMSVLTHSKFQTAIRRTMAHSFSPSCLSHSFDKLVYVMDQASHRIEREAKNGSVDLQDLFLDMATDIIGKVGFDQDFGSLDKTGTIHHCFIEAFVHFTDELIAPHKQLYMKLFPNSKLAQRKKQSLDTIYKEHEKIMDAFLSRPYPPDEEQALWANLRRLKDPDTGRPIERKKLVGEVISMVGAAMDTTGHQLGWVFTVLSDHPEVVERLLNDMREIGLCGPGARDPEYADLSSLPYLTAVVKECMRMVSSVSILTVRMLPKDMEILGYRLPEGMQVYVPANVYSHLVENFEDPEVFNPERFMNGQSYEFYIPFGYGPRDCVGQRLGFLEIQLTLLLLLPRFHFKLSKGMTFKDVMEKQYHEEIMASAKGGLWFDVAPRNATEFI